MHGVLDFFFEADYYVEACEAAKLCIKTEVNLNNAFEHYRQHGIEDCFPPNEYFYNNKNLLNSNTGECFLSDWLKEMPTRATVDKKKSYTFIHYGYSDKRGVRPC